MVPKGTPIPDEETLIDHDYVTLAKLYPSIFDTQLDESEIFEIIHEEFELIKHEKMYSVDIMSTTMERSIYYDKDRDIYISLDMQIFDKSGDIDWFHGLHFSQVFPEEVTYTEYTTIDKRKKVEYN